MKVNYTPKVCQGDDAKFEGSIELKMPTFDQRFQYMEECGFELDEDGNPIIVETAEVTEGAADTENSGSPDDASDAE